MSTRLTKEMRAATVAALLKHKFEAAEKALCLDVEQFGRDCFAHFMGKDNPRDMAKCPAGWFRHEQRLDFEVSNQRPYFDITTDYNTGKVVVRLSSLPRWTWPILLEKSHPIPYYMAETSKRQIKRDNPLWSVAESLNNRAAKLNEERREVDAKTYGALAAFTTVEKLVKAWPEVAEFIPGGKPPAMLPALPVEDLNKMLGL